MSLSECHDLLPATISQHYYIEGLVESIKRVLGHRWMKQYPIIVVLSSGVRERWEYTRAGKWELTR